MHMGRIQGVLRNPNVMSKTELQAQSANVPQSKHTYTAAFLGSVEK